MNLALVIYIIDRLDAVVYGPLTFLSYSALVILATLGVVYHICGGEVSALSFKRKVEKGLRTGDGEDFAHFYYSLPKKAIMWCCMPLAVAFLLVPDKDTMYTILAAYGVQEVAANENVQEFAGKSLDVLEKAMDEYLAGKD